ncbi:hypothetical protein GCM10010172_60230 [Paractinoplanes ferrugineus]|uniref:Uncharacterized protein n=1 Tax=Paractinoplanes ferrugineus TaxID=113564 RepID=A0A919JGC3_9ACTN|nr:hypothetical protein [Actinoplanes ferrugineus]GIE16701.1 hypothetical protein Afe05nite_85410 [Actinoplanes ferrugineus]
MNTDFRIRTEWDDDLFTEPVELYYVLDSLEPGEPGARVEPVEPDGIWVDVSVNPAGTLDVKFRVSSDSPTQDVVDIDILDVYQALLEYVGGEANWPARFRIFAAGRASGGDPRSVDYAPTSLTIAVAMLDKRNRATRLGWELSTPPVIRWGAEKVITGDLWTGLPAEGVGLIRVDRLDETRQSGVAINVPGGRVIGPNGSAAAEAVFWPQVDGREIEFKFTAPRGTLGVCNVYLVGDDSWSRVERWTEDAGMIAHVDSGTEKSYRCNHASTQPPHFNDLIFRLTLSVNEIF